MKLLLLIVVLSTAIEVYAKDNPPEKQQLTLDLKPNFALELKHQAQIAKDMDSHAIENAKEQKRIHDIEHQTGRKFVGMNANFSR